MEHNYLKVPFIPP